MIFMPGTSRDVLPRLWRKGVIDNEKEQRLGFNIEPMKELLHSNLCHFFHSPDMVPQKPGETGKSSMQEGTAERLNHGGRMGFPAQVDKSHDKG